MNSSAIIWLVIMIVFLVLEMITVSLVSIWFVGGSLVAFLISFVTDLIWVQVAVFIVVSIAFLMLLRPIAKKFAVKDKDKMKSGAQALVGKRAIVTEAIDNLHAKGAVQVNGQYWSARTQDDHVTIEKDSIVRIKEVDGVCLMVEKAT